MKVFVFYLTALLLPMIATLYAVRVYLHLMLSGHHHHRFAILVAGLGLVGAWKLYIRLINRIGELKWN